MLIAHCKQAREIGMVELVAVIVREHAQAAHVMDFHAAPDVVLPSGQADVHCAERQQEAVAVLVTFVDQPGVGPGDVFVQNTIERPGPRLRDAVMTQHFDEVSGVVAAQSAKGPARMSGSFTNVISMGTEFFYRSARSISCCRRGKMT